MLKKSVFTAVCALVALLVPVVSFAAAEPKKKSSKNAETITTAAAWTKKAKDFERKNVTTFALEVGNFGEVMSDAPAAVVPVETGDKKFSSGGKILVVLPTAEIQAFAKKYVRKAESADSAFGGKIKYEKISGVFAKVGDEFVLLYKIKAADLTDFSPSKALAAQKGTDESVPAKSSREGFSKKIFRVSKIGEKAYPKAEFKRLVALHNKTAKKSEKMKESDIKSLLEDEENFFTVFDEKAKIEWELRN